MISPHDIANGLKKGKCVGNNKYVACCPAHEDKTPSLHITLGQDNKILVHCFSGCSQSEIIDCLKSMGLWPEKEKIDRPPGYIPPEPIPNTDDDLLSFDHAEMVLALSDYDKGKGKAFLFTPQDLECIKKAEETYQRLFKYFHWSNLTGAQWRRMKDRRFEIASKIMAKFVKDGK